MNEKDPNLTALGIATVVGGSCGLTAGIAFSRWSHKSIYEKIYASLRGSVPTMSGNPEFVLAREVKDLFAKKSCGDLSWEKWAEFTEYLIWGDLATLKDAPELWTLHKHYVQLHEQNRCLGQRMLELAESGSLEKKWDELLKARANRRGPSDGEAIVVALPAVFVGGPVFALTYFGLDYAFGPRKKESN